MRLPSILDAQNSICKLPHTFNKWEKQSTRSITSHLWHMTDILICLTITYWHKTRLPSEKQCKSKSSECIQSSVAPSPAASTLQYQLLTPLFSSLHFKLSQWICHMLKLQEKKKNSTNKCYILQNIKVHKVLTTCHLPERKIWNASRQYKPVDIFRGLSQVYYLFLWKKTEKKIKILF